MRKTSSFDGLRRGRLSSELLAMIASYHARISSNSRAALKHFTKPRDFP